MTTLIISNKEMKDIMRIVTYPEESGLLLKSFSQTIENEAKEQKDGFVNMLVVTLAASLLTNLLEGKEVTRADEGVIQAGEGAPATN